MNYHTENIDHLIADNDECRTGNHNCEQKCVNTEGSYSCKCLSGYELRRDKRTCNGKTVMTICGRKLFKFI